MSNTNMSILYEFPIYLIVDQLEAFDQNLNISVDYTFFFVTVEAKVYLITSIVIMEPSSKI